MEVHEQYLAFVEKNVICTVNGWQRRPPAMSRRRIESRSMMVADATDGDDRDGVDGAKVDYIVTDDREAAV